MRVVQKYPRTILLTIVDSLLDMICQAISDLITLKNLRIQLDVHPPGNVACRKILSLLGNDRERWAVCVWGG